MGVPYGGVPARVRALPAHLRAPDTEVRGVVRDVRGGGKRSIAGEMRISAEGAREDKATANGDEPPVPDFYPRLPGHHHGEPIGGVAAGFGVQVGEELLQLRRCGGKRILNSFPVY